MPNAYPRTTLLPLIAALFGLATFWACGPADAPAAFSPAAPWDSIVAQAQGQTLRMMMWQGDPQINAYMRDWVAPELRQRFGIELQIAAGQGPDIVQALSSEMQAGRRDSELDLLWINGETFFQLRQIGALFGPWVPHLPHAAYIDFQNPFIGQDFQQPIEGYECPWGNVQMALIYRADLVASPPQSRAELYDWVRAHPGKFTWDTRFTGMTLLKAWLIDIAGGGGALDGPFDEAKYARHSSALWAYVDSLRPHLWREGRTFPEELKAMHTMFANGELWFTMSNNDAEVDNKILQGVFDSTALAYVPAFGSIQNSHYLGIPARSGRKAAAMVAANFLISPEAQWRKLDPRVWGDGTVLDAARLPGDWPQRFAELPGRRRAPARSSIQPRALRELAPEYMLRLQNDFRTRILGQ